MNWLQSLYEVAGSSYPRLSIVVAALVGAVVFGGGWWLVGRQYAKDHPIVSVQATTAIPQQGPRLLPQQRRLLELLAQYQRQFAASKLIISRTDGRLHFDGVPNRGANVSIVHDLYGEIDPRNAGRFEELLESMPSEYIRLIAEARWDNPFVVSVTSAGIDYLAQHP